MNVSIRIDVTDNFLCRWMHSYALRVTLHKTLLSPLGISGSLKLMETNRESSAARGAHRRAYNVNDIYYGALRNYAINTRSFESAKNCSLRDARVTVDAIKITLLVYLVHLPGRTFFDDSPVLRGTDLFCASPSRYTGFHSFARKSAA